MTAYVVPEGHIICLRRNVPRGWEYRTTATAPWQEDCLAQADIVQPDRFVEARPPQPQPAPEPYALPEGHVLVPAGRGAESVDVPDGWRIASALYELAPAGRLPDPEAQATWVLYGERQCIATTVGQMRDRVDLDQWEWANAASGKWIRWPRYFMAENDDFPVVVRRKEPGR